MINTTQDHILKPTKRQRKHRKAQNEPKHKSAEPAKRIFDHICSKLKKGERMINECGVQSLLNRELWWLQHKHLTGHPAVCRYLSADH